VRTAFDVRTANTALAQHFTNQTQPGTCAHMYQARVHICAHVLMIFCTTNVVLVQRYTDKYSHTLMAYGLTCEGLARSVYVYTSYMTVFFVTFLPKLPYTHRIYSSGRPLTCVFIFVCLIVAQRHVGNYAMHLPLLFYFVLFSVRAPAILICYFLSMSSCHPTSFVSLYELLLSYFVLFSV
jgi:hypothetical protein